MNVLRIVVSTVLVVAVAALPPCDDARRLDGSPCDPQTVPPTAAPTESGSPCDPQTAPADSPCAPQTTQPPPTGGPCDPVVSVCATPPPPPPPQTTTRPPPLYVEPVCLQPEDHLLPELRTLPGAFKPWVAYKYLKANGPFVTTASKDLMGGQTLQVKNAGTPIKGSDFKCVKEDNEWKARIKDEALVLETLTIRLLDGWCDAWNVKTLGPKPMHCLVPVEECLLQDISLYRSMDDMLGLRFDYGHCPRMAAQAALQPGTKQATIMIGLKRVPDSALATPNVRGFFEDLCHTENSTADPATTSLNLANAKPPNLYDDCFARTADSEDVSALDHYETLPCFNNFRVYTLLDVNNRFPVLPVMDSDYAWLLSKLPVDKDPKDSPCAPVNQIKAMYGSVKMDRVCVHLEGMQKVTCNNVCGKVCNQTFLYSIPDLQPQLPAAICIDCEWIELLYAIFASIIVVVVAYYTYMSNRLGWIRNYINMGAKHLKSPHAHFDSFTSNSFAHTALPSNPRNRDSSIPQDAQMDEHGTYRHSHESLFPAYTGMLLITGIVSIITYYVINVLDTLICRAFHMEQCVRVWPQQYVFDADHYMAVNGTEPAMSQQHLTIAEAGLSILPWVGVDKMINVNWCPERLYPMIVATWISTWILMCWWRQEQKIPIMKTVITQEIHRGGMENDGHESVTHTSQSHAEHAHGITHAGIGQMADHGEIPPVQGHGRGMLTKTLAFFGGGSSK